MYQKSEDSHHGGAALVELDGPLRELGLRAERVPPEVDETVAEIPDEGVRSGNVLHHEELEEADEEEDLELAVGGDGIRSEEGGDAVGVRGEGIAGRVDVARDVQAGAGDDVAEEGELADASMLDLDVPEAVEPGLAGLVEEAEGIEEAEGGLGAELGFEGGQGRGGLGHLGGGEGGRGGGEGGEDGELHHGWEEEGWWGGRESANLPEFVAEENEPHHTTHNHTTQRILIFAIFNFDISFVQ